MKYSGTGSIIYISALLTNNPGTDKNSFSAFTLTTGISLYNYASFSDGVLPMGSSMTIDATESYAYVCANFGGKFRLL